MPLVSHRDARPGRAVAPSDAVTARASPARRLAHGDAVRLPPACSALSRATPCRLRTAIRRRRALVRAVGCQGSMPLEGSWDITDMADASKDASAMRGIARGAGLLAPNGVPMRVTHADADADMFVAFSGTGEHVVGDGVPSEPCAPDQHVAVRTVCHGLDDAWADRDVAVPFFIAAMEATDGSESEHYQGVLAGLLEGRTVCTGE